MSGTKNAVTPMGTVVHDTAAERDTFTSAERGGWGEEVLELRDRFFDGFNRWVASLRP